MALWIYIKKFPANLIIVFAYQLKPLLYTNTRFKIIKFTKIGPSPPPQKISVWRKIRRCIQKFSDWVDNEINKNKNKHSLRSNTKCYDGKIH